MVGVVSLLTDFGSTDYYVGAVKATLLRLAPGAQPVDITHDLAPGDVEAASFVLSAAAPSFPAGTVHLAVVDPGVGGARRILAVETEDALFVAPDNGLLSRQFEGARVHAVEDDSLFLPAPGQTFHGRDRFAPVAASLLRGEPLSRLGPQIDDPVRLALPPPAREGERLRGRVAHVDRYGNLVTDVLARWLEAAAYEARIGEHRTRRRVSAYCELPDGEAGWLIGSLGTVELSLNGSDLARAWSVARGAQVFLEQVTLEAAPAGTEDYDHPTRTDAAPGGTKTPREQHGQEETAMTKWEYKIINVRSENYRLDPNAAGQLDALGAKGWELISITSVNFKTGATDNIAMVFKRPVES